MLLLVRNSHHNSVKPLKLSGMAPLKHLPSNQICDTHMKFSSGQGTQANPSTPRSLGHCAGLWPHQRKGQA